MMTLGQRLQKAREHARITQEDLAKKTGVRQSAISRIELGKAYSSGYVVAIGAILGMLMRH
jgi:transcriptional regulator with XRE-family HTH domain